MKVSWEAKPLGKVCQFINRGISPTYLESGGVAVLNQKCVRDHAVNFDLGRRHDAAVKKVTPERFVRAGDVLVNSTGTGTLGRVAQLREDPPEPTTVDSHVTIVRPTEGLFCPEFFGYALVAIEEQIQAGGEGCGGQTELSRTKLAEGYQVSFPTDHHQQRRIVAILDEAFEGIATAKANAEKNLQNARQVFENHLERVFARRCDLWPETNLGAIAAIKGGKRVPKGYKLLDEDTGYPYLRVTDFGLRGSIDMNDLRYVSPAVHAEIKNYIITPRDLYISIAGTIGRTGIIPDELDGANLTENACRLVFNSGVSNRFVYYYTKTPAFIEQAGFNTRTAAQPKLALSRLATIRLPMPNFEVQASVVTALNAIAEGVEVLEGIYQAKATALDELKKSLLHQAFSGAL